MSFTAFKALFAPTLALAITGGTHAQATGPRVLHEPLFGLEFDTRKEQLPRLPDDVRNSCMELADNEYMTTHMWIFASAGQARTTYYVVGGYVQRRHPAVGEREFRLDDRGGVFRIEGGTCTGIGPVREVFAVRPLDEVPQSVLQQLAAGMANTLKRICGGKAALEKAMQRKGIAPSGLPPELRDAFRP